MMKNTPTDNRWFMRLATWLKRHGRYRMIYRDADRLDRSGDSSERGPYLERFYILSTKWIGIYIHRFWASDPDGLHDHPWSSFSWILQGNYKEEIAGETLLLKRGPGSKHYRPAQEAHRITLDEPGSCWTMFIRFKRKRLWGFYRSDGWKPAVIQSGKKL